ncbi:carboxypeptidase regulatory-like domain-containing protein [bacterium]|nr:carboxypeptidase regulatory-like domain-containing protein [bacterium]
MAYNEQITGNKRMAVIVSAQIHSITDLTATSEPGGDIALSWSAIPGSEHYNIYRSVTFGVKGEKISLAGDTVQPDYVDDKGNLIGGKRYFYVAQAVVGGIEESRGNYQASAVSDQGGPNAPIILSSTHPKAGQPYAHANPSFYWVHSGDSGQSQSVAGYYVKLDKNAVLNTLVSESGWEYVTTAQKSYTLVGNGIWYFHCVARDQSGNPGTEAVYQIQIIMSGAIQGIVTTVVTGFGLSGVVVEAWRNGQKQQETITVAQGTYQITELPFATYQLRFNYFGYYPQVIEAVELDLESSPKTIDVVFDTKPVIAAEKSAAYPNPATGPEVRFIYFCEESSKVIIEIYNVVGERIAKIRDNKPSGYQYSILPLNKISRGVYLYRVIIQTQSGKRTILQTEKFSVVK